jgi:3-oxoacyl-[acyl-carrier-protein] synthase II
MKLKRVVVTGLGALSPLGNNIPDFWNNLINGVSGADYITHFDASKFKTQFACEIKGLDTGAFFDRKEIRKYDLYAQYALISTEEMMKDANIDLSKVNLDRAGVIWGSGIGGINTFLSECRDFIKGDGTPRFSPFFIPKMISDIAAGHISIRFGFRGPNFTTTSACASSANALIDAFNYIRFGKADLFITGGSEAAINETGVGGFNAMHAISVRNDSPKTASRPFDKDRDGFVLGEGAGSILLEEYEHAIRRGAKIYAEVLGGGLSADAYHMTAPHPDGNGAMSVMKNAIEDAEISKNDIDYINVHGTSTPAGDISEIKAILNIFGEQVFKINISSTKSMTGHLLGAAGAIESIVAILSTKYDIIPPTINHFELDPEIDSRLNLTFNEAQKREVNIAMSNTFGFGGHNASIIFKKFVQ